ncbi:tRNA lysidine(34) synthetase TilS [Rhodovulum sp. DZ06]|uniref:tRNA lysidine(34) synthetase TilS n=1 Tax=Rhodovulum sp. DZ06 TaxID=3425126 RepID=UPI003D347B8D
MTAASPTPPPTWRAPGPDRPGDAAAAAAAQATIHAALDRLAPDGALGVALSGGSDSLGLTLAARDWAAARGRALHAVTIDHRLRPESAAEAAHAGAVCAGLGIPHDILAWEHDGAPAGNLAAAARDARRRLLADWAAGRCAAVLLGHTRDDQAETLLLRLARGAGVDGLSAMAESARTEAGLPLLRPALGASREGLRALCRRHGLGWVEDPTNDDLSHDRPRARAALAALAPLGIDAAGLAATADRLRGQRAALEAQAEALSAAALEDAGAGALRLDLSAWRTAPRDIRLRVLAGALHRVAGGARPRARALGPLADALEAAGEGAMPARALAGTLTSAAGGAALIHREPAALPPPVPARPGAAWDGRWRVENPPEGCVLGALGAAGLSALKRARADGAWTPPAAWAALPRAARAAAPALMRAGALLRCPHAAYPDPAPGPVLHDDRGTK